MIRGRPAAGAAASVLFGFIAGGAPPAPSSPAPATSHPPQAAVQTQPPPAVALAASGRIHLEFDARVPEDLVRLVEGKIIDDDSLDAWVDLPGNAELLRLGASRGDLDREELRENLWHSILGHRSRRGTGLGSLAFDPLADLTEMIGELRTRESEIARRVAERVESYLPEEAPEIHAVVRLHLGGTWDARAPDDIYLNLSLFHSYAPPWFDAVEALIAHEVTHLVHRRLDGPPDGADAPEGLFAVALAQIHSEGIARQVGHGLFDGQAPPGTYAAFALRRENDGLAGFADALGRADDLRRTCLVLKDTATCRRRIVSGLWQGGDTYAAGHGMAQAIESALGRRTLASTLSAGAARFFELYAQATRMLPGLPPLGDEFEKSLPAAASYLAARREAWLLRKEARDAHLRGDYQAAEAALRRLISRDDRDPTAAYNLACALARQGNSEGAVEWLERAVGLGYADRGHMESDPDLDSLRGAKAYRRLVETMGTAAVRSRARTAE